VHSKAPKEIASRQKRKTKSGEQKKMDAYNKGPGGEKTGFEALNYKKEDWAMPSFNEWFASL
jgi:hypothetical protein